MDVKRRWRSLNHKIEHLKLELEDREETINSFEVEFMQALSEVEVEDLPDAPSPADVPSVINKVIGDVEDVTSAEIVESPEEAKKLWRSIASAAHPDKTGGDPDKTELYKAAAEAWRTGAIDELHRIAVKLGIETPDATQGGVELLQETVDGLEKKLKDSETSVLWMWGTTTPEKRRGIIDIYLRSKGKRRKPPSQPPDDKVNQ